MRLSTGEKTFQVFNTLFMLSLAFIFLYPFWYVLVLSFNDGLDAAKGGIYWWPRMLSLDNYRSIFRDNAVMTAYQISILRTVVGTFGTMVVTTLAAFGLSRKELMGRNALFLIIFFTMLFGGGLIPYYLLLQDLHFLNHFQVYVVPGLFNAFWMIVMITSFRAIPESLTESAEIDGANYFQQFYRIIIPLSLPMLAALALFVAVGHWNDWFTGAFFNQNANLEPLQTYLYKLLTAQMYIQNGTSSGSGAGDAASKALAQIEKVTPKSIRMATLIITAVPILCVYPLLQPYFVKGALIGSVKE